MKGVSVTQGPELRETDLSDMSWKGASDIKTIEKSALEFDL